MRANQIWQTKHSLVVELRFIESPKRTSVVVILRPKGFPSLFLTGKACFICYIVAERFEISFIKKREVIKKQETILSFGQTVIVFEVDR